MDPARQYEAYHTYAIKNNLLSGKFIKESEQFLSKCKAKLSVNEKVLAVNECEELPSVLERASKSSGQNCLNMYDIRLRDDTPDGGCGMKWPPGLGKMKEILNVGSIFSCLSVFVGRLTNPTFNFSAYHF